MGSGDPQQMIRGIFGGAAPEEDEDDD